MTDIADLAFRADSSGITKAVSDLDKLDKSADRVTGSTGGMERETKKANKAFGSMGTSIGRAIGPLAAFASASLAIGGSIGIIKEFDQSMAEVAAISRATGEEMAAMSKIARELGATTAFSAAEAAQGMRFLSQAGFTASESIQSIPDVLNLAKAAALELGQAADIASNVMSGFGIAATDAAGAADILAAISSRANTNVQQLGEGAKFVGPVAAAMGISLGDAAAAMGVLSDAGIQGSAAGTGLRRVLSSLANPTKEAASVLNSLGVSLNDVNPATNDLTDVIDVLAKSGIDAADALTIFGDRGGPAILALTANSPRVKELADQMANVEGEAARMAETMGDTLEGDVLALKSAMSELALAIGDSGLNAAMRTLVQYTTNLLRSLGPAVAVVGDVVPWVAGTAAVWAFNAALVALQGLTISGAIAAGIGLITASAWKLVAVVTTLHPATLALGAAFAGFQVGKLLNEFDFVQRAAFDVIGAIDKMIVTFGAFADTASILITTAAGNISNELREIGASVNEFVAGLDLLPDSMQKAAEERAKELRALIVPVEDLEDATRGLREEYKKSLAAIDDNVASLKAAVGVNAEAAKGTDKLVSAQRDSVKTVEDLTGATGDFSDSQETSNEEAAKFADRLQSIIDAADPAAAEIREITAAYDDMSRGLEQGLVSSQQWAAFLDAALPEVVVDAERITASMDIAGQKAEDAARKTEAAWGDARETLSDFFFELAADGASAFDTLVDGFRNMINKMIAEWAASGLIGLFKGEGFGGFATGAIGEVVAGGASSIFGSSSASGSELTDTISTAGSAASAVSTVSGGSAGGATVAGAMSVAGYAAIAAAAYQAYQDITAERYTISDALSGDFFRRGGYSEKADDILPGLGSKFLEPTIDALSGNPFGIMDGILSSIPGIGDGKSNNRVFSQFSGGEFGETYVTDKGNHRPQREAVEAIMGMFQPLVDAIGGTEYEALISASAKRGFELNKGVEGEDVFRTKKPEEFVGKIFEGIIDGAGNLDENLRALLTSFDGTGTQAVNLATAIFSTIGPQQAVSESFADLASSTEFAGDEAVAFAGTLFALASPVEEVSDSIAGLVDGFKGSAEETALFAATLLNLSDTDINDSLVRLIDAFDGSATATINYAGTLLEAVGAATELDASFVDLVLGFSGTEDQTAAFTQHLLRLSSATKEVGRDTQDLIENFEGGPESLVAFSGALVDIRNILDSNPLSDAVSAFEASLAESGQTVAGAYLQQAMFVQDLARESDGSAESIFQLRDALAGSAQLAGLFAQTLEQAKLSISGMTETTADFFRVSVMSERELRDSRVGRLNELEDILESSFDPQVLTSAFEEFSSLSKTVFEDLLDDIRPEKLSEFGEEFALNIEKFGELVQGRLAESEDLLGESIDAQFGTVDAMLSVHAASYDDSARRTQEATTRFERAAASMEQTAQRMQEAGISFAQPQVVSVRVNGVPVTNGGEINL